MNFKTQKEAVDFAMSHFSQEERAHYQKFLPYRSFIYGEREGKGWMIDYSSKKENPFFLLTDEDIKSGCFFNLIQSFSEGMAAVKKAKKFGLIDEQGTLVTDFQFDFVWFFSEGFAKVKKDGKWGLIDEQGELFYWPFTFIYSIAIEEKKYSLNLNDSE